MTVVVDFSSVVLTFKLNAFWNEGCLAHHSGWGLWVVLIFFGGLSRHGLEQIEKPVSVNKVDSRPNQTSQDEKCDNDDRSQLGGAPRLDQAWSLTQINSVNFAQPRISEKRAFSTNTQSRFVSVVVDLCA